MEIIAGAIGFGFFIGIGLLVLIALAKQFLFIGRPNEVLVFSGRERQLGDGSKIGYRELIGGGRSWRIPVFEKVDSMNLSTIPIDIRVSNAYSKGGIPLQVHAIANIKITSEPELIGNAIERFMGRDIREIQRVGKETLEGHLRGVLATLTPEEVNEDRLQFGKKLSEEADDDFDKLGLHIDTLKIQNVTDPVNYLESIGRSRIAEVIRDAEIAESTARAEAQQAEANSRREAEVAVQTAQTAIVKEENKLRELRAQLEAEIKSVEAQAERAAAAAKAQAEAELQSIRQELEGLRLQADKVIPAEAQQKAEEFISRGAAAVIEENGHAQAEVLKMLTEAWIRAGKDAEDIFLIQQLEEVLTTVVSRVNGMEINEVVLLDGGDGQALPNHIASFPAMVRQVLQELHSTTGVDVTGILSGNKITVDSLKNKTIDVNLEK
jgi:flotillin